MTANGPEVELEPWEAAEDKDSVHGAHALPTEQHRTEMEQGSTDHSHSVWIKDNEQNKNLTILFESITAHLLHSEETSPHLQSFVGGFDHWQQPQKSLL